MTEDLRKTRTKHAIKLAFANLLNEKPLTKITVRDIAQKAFINRQTFYLYYENKYDLAEKMTKEIIAQFSTLLDERLEKGSALNKLEKIYSQYSDYFNTHSQEILGLLDININNITLRNELQKVFIDRYQKANNIQLTRLQADIFSTLYIESLAIFIKDKRLLSSDEIESILDQIRDFIK